MLWRIALIIIVAPIATALASLLVLGEGAFLVLAGYPVLVAGSALCAPAVHLYIRRVKPPLGRQAALFCLLGFAGGGLFVSVYFSSSPGGPAHFLRAVILYGAVGVLHAMVLWGMYSFGPLRVVRRQAESAAPSVRG